MWSSLKREKTMPEICVKSFAFQYEKQFIKEVKNYALPYNIYNNLVKEINEEPPLNINDYLINTELNYTLNSPPHSGDDGNWYKCGDGNWYKWGNIKVKEDRTLKMILSALFESCSWRNHYLHVYWDYDKNILTFEEEYGDKYEN